MYILANSFQGCGKRLKKTRATTTSDQNLICALLILGTQGQITPNDVKSLSKGGSGDLNISWLKDLERCSVDETGLDITEASRDLPSGSTPDQRSSETMSQGTKRRVYGHDKHENTMRKFLYSCYPTSSNTPSRDLDEFTITTESERPSDQKIIQRMREQYYKLRPSMKRWRSLRGFSGIRLARVGTSRSKHAHVPV